MHSRSQTRDERTGSWMIPFAVYGGCAVMLLGFLLLLSAGPKVGAWGLIMMLAGASVAAFGKLVDMSRPGRDPW